MEYRKTFGHKRASRTDLVSTILVETLLLEHKDIFAIGTLILDLQWPKFDDGIEQDSLDKKRVAYTFCTNIDDQQKSLGSHCGDCTCVASPCSRCISEEIYIEGSKKLDEFNTFLINNNTDCTDLCIKLLSILFALEHEWLRCDLLITTITRHNANIPALSNENNVHQQYDRLWDNIRDFQYCYDYWKSLSLEQKELCHNRAVRFRAYFDNRPIVEGIPWW